MRYFRITGPFSGHSVIALLAMLLAVPVVYAAPAADSGTNYEIPISELNRVEKKTTSKRVRSEPRRKKKTEPAPQKTQETAKPVESPESMQILHSPFSFVVADKRTVISVVINSKADIKEVNCTLPAVEGGKDTLVKMEKVNGTLYTYTATLPGQPLKSSALRYTISFIDSKGVETRSRDFVTPVSPSPLVPSWQIENNPTEEVAGAVDESEPKKVLPQSTPKNAE